VRKSQSEIEIKWFAKEITRERFNRFVFSIIEKVPSTEWSFKKASGPDYYFVNALNFVARHRDGEDCKELTVKARLSDESITERIEINLPLDLKGATKDLVHGWLRRSGYRKVVTLLKDCNIFVFKMESSPVHATVVWYKVKSKGFEDQIFIEVEVDNGTKKQRNEVLRYFKKLVRSGLGLGPESISHQSLLETYSDRRYMVLK